MARRFSKEQKWWSPATKAGSRTSAAGLRFPAKTLASTAPHQRVPTVRPGRNDEGVSQLAHALRNARCPAVAVAPDHGPAVWVGLAAVAQSRGHALRPSRPAERLDDARRSSCRSSRCGDRGPYRNDLDAFASKRD